MRARTVALVGYGAVGKSMHQLFPSAVVYDRPLELGDQAQVNECEFAFIAVPTPGNPDGSCNTDTVEECVAWIQSPIIVIRSTVSVGTTQYLSERYGKRIVFQPEYGPGETPDHPFYNPRGIRWLILGGERGDTIAVADLYKTVFNADLVIQQTNARTAELTKYMENAFLAFKVAFCNEFYDIASALNVDYNELRELWLLDPRIGKSHTFVFPNDRGFGGKCLPKDLDSIIHAAQQAGREASLLKAVREANRQVREQEDIASA